MPTILNTKVFTLLLLFSICIWEKINGQSTHEGGILPTINITKKLNANLEANFKWESRHSILNSEPLQRPNYKYNYALNDFAVIISKKFGLNSKVSGGYLMRFTSGQVIHRSIQQFTLVRKLNRFKLAHRIVSDQTFSKSATSWRFRYRVGLEIPLNGYVTDAKEFYIKLTNEYLNIFKNSDYDLELRLSPKFGYKFNQRNKTELGVDYRLDSFLNARSQHTYWINLSWFYGI